MAFPPMVRPDTSAEINRESITESKRNALHKFGYDDRSRGTADNTGDIADHIVAYIADPLGIAQISRRASAGRRNLRVPPWSERDVLVRRGHRHADDIKQDTDQDDEPPAAEKAAR